MVHLKCKWVNQTVSKLLGFSTFPPTVPVLSAFSTCSVRDEHLGGLALACKVCQTARGNYVNGSFLLGPQL